MFRPRFLERRCDAQPPTVTIQLGGGTLPQSGIGRDEDATKWSATARREIRDVVPADYELGVLAADPLVAGGIGQ
jgi:hypothetical protein